VPLLFFVLMAVASRVLALFLTDPEPSCFVPKIIILPHRPKRPQNYFAPQFPAHSHRLDHLNQTQRILFDLSLDQMQVAWLARYHLH